MSLLYYNGSDTMKTHTEQSRTNRYHPNIQPNYTAAAVLQLSARCGMNIRNNYALQNSGSIGDRREQVNTAQQEQHQSTAISRMKLSHTTPLA